MNYVIGLGNPGKTYQYTRHNAGHMLIDFLNQSGKLKTGTNKLFKTDCFMNVSGHFVSKILTGNGKLKPENIYIAHDDLDIPLGLFKISFAKGPKVHNGIRSIEDALGTNEFWRIRIGIDNRTPTATQQPRPTATQSGEDYVLSNFTDEEMDMLRGVFGQIQTRLA